MAEYTRVELTPEQLQAKREGEERLAPELEKEFGGFSDRGTTPYMVRKLIPRLYGARVMPNKFGDPILAIPLRDAYGKFWNYQKIYSTKFKLDDGTETDKITCKGARSKGTFHILGNISPESTIYICEGFATGSSIFQALGENSPVVVALFATNLPEVGTALAAKYPKASFIFCADNDCYKPEKGNAGRHWAGVAQGLLCNQSEIRYPVFEIVVEAGKKGPSDFQDLHALHGLEVVKAQLLAQAPEPKTEPECRGLKCLAGVTQKGLPTKPTQKRVVEYLLDEYGDRMVAQGQDFFIYGEGYWQWQDPEGVKRLKRQISYVAGPVAGANDIESMFKLLAIQAKSPPKGVDLFSPRYFTANFTNGTLHMHKIQGKPELIFKPHNPQDFITNQLPFDYPGHGAAEMRNPMFDAMLERIFKGDPDKEVKIRSLAQLYGAVIMPCYPKIFFLIGPRGSGKSTVMKLLFKLADKKNVSHVDPSEFNGFNMENMAGKLLNMDTDIDLHRPIRDSVIKKIIDRLPFRIRRKNQRDLDAPLPPIHAFGGNDLPASLEGSTGAYARRVVILKFGAFSAEAMGEGGYDLDFEQAVWEAGPEGILAFALKGLTDLLRGAGHFTVPMSSHVALTEWDEKSDLVGQFLDALAHGEVDGGSQFKVSPELEITRQDLWAACVKWQELVFGRVGNLSQKQLYAGLRCKGHGERESNHVRYFLGIGAKVSPTAHM